MSLLMDALKRAEQAKQQGVATQDLALEPLVKPDAAPPPETSAEPPATDASAARAAGQLPSLAKLEDLDAEFIAHARQAPPRARSRVGDDAMTAARTAAQAPPPRSTAAASGTRAAGNAPTPQQAAIRNAFAVKEPAADGKRVWLLIAAATLVAVAAIGAYFWMQLRPAPGIGIVAPPFTADSGRLDAPIAPTPNPAPPLAAPPAASAVAAVEPADFAPGDAPRAQSSAPVSPARREAGARKVSRDDTPPPAAAAQPAPPAAPSAGPPPIRFAKSAGTTGRPVAADGYAALQAGDLPGAQAAYERLLRNDPRNVDALHGRAAIALREGRGDDALADYLHILAIDPRNAEANAALVGLQGSGDPVAAESRIKSLLAQQPNAPALHFALGNLYARQSRWSEAQQAYFNALTTDGGNPDYLFNLAVSLDQLHQPRLAAEYYGRALAAADARYPAFDRNMAAQRLKELTPP